jgi:hypothetical protein
VHACISEIQPEEKEPDGFLRPDPLKTDMTASLPFGAGHGCHQSMDEAFFHSQSLRNA